MIRASRFFWSTVLVMTLLGVASCSSKAKTDLQYQGDPLPRPDRILVHDFGYPPGLDGTPRTETELENGRKVASVVTEHLVKEIRDMGLPAASGVDDSQAPGHSYSVEGRFRSVDQGSLGRYDVKTFAQFFRASSDGPMLVQEIEVETDASATGKEIAKKLRELFHQEGWVSK